MFLNMVMCQFLGESTDGAPDVCLNNVAFDDKHKNSVPKTEKFMVKKTFSTQTNKTSVKSKQSYVQKDVNKKSNSNHFKQHTKVLPNGKPISGDKSKSQTDRKCTTQNHIVK